MKKVLLIGGSGALGVYLAEHLLDLGFGVDIVCLDDKKSNNQNLKYIKRNAKDIGFLTELLKNEYSAIVDFMIYTSKAEYENYYRLYLDNTLHYVYLSSYRVYADSIEPITEKSPRLIDVNLPSSFVKEFEYSIFKAEGEDLLRSSGKNNWTILRPTITYSKNRFQLVTLECSWFVRRMYEGKPVCLPQEAMNVQGTLSWAGDFGRMVSRLILNPYAFKEVYTVGTAEHHTWKEFADIYTKIAGLKYFTVPAEEYLTLFDSNIASTQQLYYDRCLNRAIDNSKILNATGIKQSELMKTEDGLKMELSTLDINNLARCGDNIMDELYKKYCNK